MTERVDLITRLLGGVDDPVMPRPVFADTLLERLLDELMEDPAEDAAHASFGIQSSVPRSHAVSASASAAHGTPDSARSQESRRPQRALAILAAAAILVLTIISSMIVLRVVGPEATVTLITAPGASTIETLLDAPVESRAAERTPLTVERWRFQPAPATLHIPSLDGPQWIAVEAGQLVATVAGTERTLATGEGLVVEAGKELVLSNSSQETAAVLRGVAAVEFSLEDYDRDLVTSEIALDTDAHETLPPGISRVVFEQMVLPPGSTLRIDPASGQDWVSVVSGTLGLTLTGDGLPRGWQSGQEREVRATDHVPALARGIQVTLHNVGDDALILLRLRVMPLAEGEPAP
jgi:hypothetical protein